MPNINTIIQIVQKLLCEKKTTKKKQQQQQHKVGRTTLYQSLCV
jgi:hypothetical protein